MLVPTGGSVFILRGERGTWHCQFLCSHSNLSMNAVSLGCALRLANNLPLCAPGNLHITVFILYVSGLFAGLFSNSSLSALQAIREPRMLTFKTPNFNSHWLQELKQAPLAFQVICSGIPFLFVLLCVLICLSPFATTMLPTSSNAMIHFSPKPIATLPNFFRVASSLHLVVWFVFPVFRSISGVFRMISKLSNCICGTERALGPPTPPLSSTQLSGCVLNEES